MGLARSSRVPAYDGPPARHLNSRGSYTYGGRISGPLTAHPKIDAETGALHAFGYGLDGFGSTRMAYYHIAAAGELTRTVEFDAPYAAMVHDFIVTAGHLVFPIFPLTISAERARCGRPLLAWEPQLPALLGCLPREGGADDIGGYDGEACCVFHPLNAYQDGTQLIADMLRYDAGPGFPGADGSAPDAATAAARLERWRIPLAGTTQRYTQERLDDQTSEYPRIDERYAGLPHRYGYFSTTPSEAGAGVFDELARYDFHSGRKETFRLPAGDFISEPVFVARSADAAQGQGWLLAVVYRGAEARSDLLVLDAEQLAAGPVATAKLETRVPFGFHGNWMPV